MKWLGVGIGMAVSYVVGYALWDYGMHGVFDLPALSWRQWSAVWMWVVLDKYATYRRQEEVATRVLFRSVAEAAIGRGRE